MKALRHLTNAEKAKLFHQLLPEEIPKILDFVMRMGQTIIEEQEVLRKNWDNSQLFSFDLWLSLVREVDDVIWKYNVQLHIDSNLFSRQLFNGDKGVYMVYCLIIYITVRKQSNHQLVSAIDLLFAT